jgi:XTP/dITP diphosphohydrolase
MSVLAAKSEPLISLVVATNNAGKIAEFRELLADLPVEWLRTSDVMTTPFHVIENGDTFEQNAILKARAACLATGYAAVADDSGLEVDALLGRPGVRSARYAHEHASDNENNSALLAALASVKDADRVARFRCALAVVTPFGNDPILAFGSCEGRIAQQPRGQGGFGYDPLFLVNDCVDRSMAELGSLEKNRVSHRGRAVNNLRPRLLELFAGLVGQLDLRAI